jgi:hypothetical protein
VTFAAPPSGPSGTFTNGKTTEIDLTDSNGVAASSPFTANRTPGSYTVTASTPGTRASFNLTNQGTSTTNYAFNLHGLEFTNGGDNYYALAGAVSVDTNGNVLAGEQDYNDATGFTSPEPSGDAITSGKLTVSASTGQGTLTLVTNNSELGIAGTETLGVQFVNAEHALIIQFDGSATSSGSMDMQTLPSTLNGGYAFVLSGVDTKYWPIGLGGVFSISGTSISNGVEDVNDGGMVVATGTTFAGTVSAQDSMGRGTISGISNPVTNTPMALNYYVVGPEAIRIIDVDAADSALGSAFGQGAGTFTSASLGSSVFALETNNDGDEAAVAGMFTVPTNGTFEGVADNDEQGEVWSAFPISGSYSTSETVAGFTYDGYGSMVISPKNLGDFTTLGLYMTDPNLSLTDPNNTTGGGGALVLALDPYFSGDTGVITPQTDPARTSFAGNYAFGAQDYYTGNPGWEFDFVGQGSVASAVLNGTGLVNDPFCFFSDNFGYYSGVSFSGTAAPDPINAGRYTIPLTVSAAGSLVTFQVVIYQATGGQLFWVDEDTDATYAYDQVTADVFSGSLQQQVLLTGPPAAKKAAARTQAKGPQ